MVKKVAPLPTTVLITGESGTKSLSLVPFTRTVPPGKPFVVANCVAFSPSIWRASYLAMRRCFTGADSRRIGRFEIANGGTLFLDEIGEINIATEQSC